MNDKNVEKLTKIWQKYDKSKQYFDRKGIRMKTERYWNFYLGKQWVGCNTGGVELPILNFIKPIVQYKVSSVAQNSMVAKYSDIGGDPTKQPIYDKINEYWSQCWEKSKMDDVAWKVIKAAAVQGDSYAYWKDGDTIQPPTIISNTNIFLADENIDDIQLQPYIIVRERWDYKTVKKFAEENGVSKEDIELIATDNMTSDQILNKDEVRDKVTVLFYMDKDENGVVRTGRATKSVIIEPVEPIEGKTSTGGKAKGLTIYPIGHYCWEPVPNFARGRGEVEQLIPNQLELNKTLARRSMAVNIGAYPRLAYDANAIENPEDLDKVGVAIAVQGGNAQSINQMISYLNATNISSDADKLSNDLLQITKDLAGATDYALGNINPEQASGTAIIAVRDSSQVPLSEQIAKYKQWVEDISLLWLDLWVAYHPEGLDFAEDINENEPVMPGEEQMANVVHVSQEELRELKPMVRIDVSPDNQWTKLAEQQALDNLLIQGAISFEEYAEAMPANSSISKSTLMGLVEKRKLAQQQQLAMQEQMAMQQQAQQQPQQQAPQQNPNGVDPNEVLRVLVEEHGIPEEEAIKLMQEQGI